MSIQPVDISGMRAAFARFKAGDTPAIRVQLTEVASTPEIRQRMAEGKARTDASDRRFIEAQNACKIPESNVLSLPNVASLSKEQATTVRDCVKDYARQNPLPMTVYAANGSDKTSDLSTYKKWLDAML